MNLDPGILARTQFAFTVTFHIIFPTMSIGLAGFLAIVEGLWLKTKDEIYLQVYRFWLNIFAMGFGIGVVTGIVLSFEFGLGFARFAQFAGPAIGPLIAYEVLTAFFLEAGFLGIMLFGMHRVGKNLHFISTCMVALGTLISASWILSANSWMQTPDGVQMKDGKLVVINWWHVIHNPSWLYRLPHMIAAAYLTASFQMEAAEGFWEKQSSSPAPYYWLIVPDQKEQRNRFALGTPYLGSIWLAHSIHGRGEGLKNTPRELQPRMAMVFYGFRVMYCIAIVMFGVACAGLWLRWKRRLFTTPWFLRVLVLMTPSGIFATLGGWYLAETGRQPWVIFGMLRTVDAVSPVPAKTLLSTLIAFVCLYTLFMTAFLIFIGRIIKRGPQEIGTQVETFSSLKHAFRLGVLDKKTLESTGGAR